MKRLGFKFIGATWREMWLFEHFYFLPCFATFSQNTYKYGKEYLFTRYFVFQWLWYQWFIMLDYGKADKELL